MMTNTNGEITPQPENLTAEILQLKIFGSTGIGDFIKETVEGVQQVEADTRLLFEKIKVDVLTDGQNKMKIEDVILVAPIAKDYLTLLSQQADNRTKILKAITDLVKAQHAPVAFNTMINTPTPTTSPQQDQIRNVLSEIDMHREDEMNKKSGIKHFDDDDEEEEIPGARPIDDAKKVSIIHSYGFKKKE